MGSLPKVLCYLLVSFTSVFSQLADVKEITSSEIFPQPSNDTELFIGDISSKTDSDRGLLKYETVRTGDVLLRRHDDGIVVAHNSSMGWMLDLFNPHRMLPFVMRSKLGATCEDEMKIYLKALDMDEAWAAKMSDAGGKYSSQFYFGGSFWLGSEGLCAELSNPKLNKQVPPYQVGFRVAKLSITLSQDLTPKPRTYFVGFCLPQSCTPNDTSALVSTIGEQQRKNGTSLQVISIRPVPGNYSIFRDVKFHAFGGSILIVILLLILGTAFEHYYEKEKKTSGYLTDNRESARNQSDVENNNNNKTKLEIEKNSHMEKKTEKDQKPANSMIYEILVSFSVTSNGAKILNCDLASEDSLTSVHGLRFFSLAWVILVHTYLQLFAIGENKTVRTVTERSFMYQTIGNATFSVDSFFFISGLLVSYLFFKNEGSKTSDNDGNPKVVLSKFFSIVCYRFIRLTPVYFVALSMILLSMKFITNMSVFEPTVIDNINCENYWWRNILYVNNFYPRTEMCMLWSWYMATDTQFFVLSAILLLIAKKKFKFTATSMLVILVSSWLTTGIISYVYDYKARVQEPFALFDELYDKPWTRMGPYVVGIITGWLLFKTNCRISMSVPMVILGWASSLLCLLSLVYGLGNGLGVALSSVYVALGHTAWGASLAWIVIACRCGYGGFVNTVLSYPALYPLSRLTYCAYLVHPAIMYLTSYVMDGPFHLHNGFVVIVYLGNMVSSYLLSFLLSIAFEAPIVRLLKLLMSPRKR